ncbi:hypothetical protein I79_017362 [Cricetulus griseus]|uniref:Uncharacterized protein n=1 Tax=Cricetulus griseus TaxID=10029 RepID=G3I1U4_CRIGR|nr:hypothetical protein I79_017362 [Cricetulus griseus]
MWVHCSERETAGEQWLVSGSSACTGFNNGEESFHTYSASFLHAQPRRDEMKAPLCIREMTNPNPDACAC